MTDVNAGELNFNQARNRKEKLAIALAHLEQNGISAADAYGPLPRALARIGIVTKPLFYGSWFGVTAFFMVVLTIVAALVLLFVGFTGFMPRPVATAIEAGPVVFVVLALVLSLVFTGVTKSKAKKMNLPNWRDL